MDDIHATYQGKAVFCKRISTNEFQLIIPQIKTERDLNPGEFTINGQPLTKLIWEATGPTGTKIRAIL